jgi:hypothetical protein
MTWVFGPYRFSTNPRVHGLAHGCEEKATVKQTVAFSRFPCIFWTDE